MEMFSVWIVDLVGAGGVIFVDAFHSDIAAHEAADNMGRDLPPLSDDDGLPAYRVSPGLMLHGHLIRTEGRIGESRVRQE